MSNNALVDKPRLSKHLNPWEKICWPPKIQEWIYRSWGQYYEHRNQPQDADRCFKSVLAIKLDDVKALYYCSRARRQMADVEGALEYAKRSRSYDADMMEANYEICKCLGELNDFEGAKIELHESLKKFKGGRSRPFSDYLDALNATLEDTLGPTLAPFLVNNTKTCKEVIERQLAKYNRITRPLWRILKDKNECDVVSILEENERLRSPIETSRNELKFKVANQHYLHKNWKDVDFLKYLCSDPQLIASPSEPKLSAYVKRQYDGILKFIKMLHARKPMYKLLSEKAMSGKLFEKKKEDHLFRVQHQSHRTIASVLNNVRIYRELGKIKKLSNYVDDVFGNYLCYKTYRIMPCKFEYVHELLNTLALAYIDKYLQSPPLVKEMSAHGSQMTLHLSMNRKAEKSIYALSRDNSYEQAQVQMMQYQNVRRLKKRLVFARYTIEKAYLLHEVSRYNLMYHKFDECVSAAKTSYEIAKEGNCYLWAFLSLMLIAKSHATLHRLEQLYEVLGTIEHLCYKLKSRKLLKYIKRCQENNVNEIEARMRSSYGSIKRSRMSSSSWISSEDDGYL